MSSACITPNPDIAGIGVRVAMYAQAVLTIVQPLMAASDGRIDDWEWESLHTLYIGILLPSCALLFCAIIQAKTFGLSAYHALIVLNLSWINNTSTLTFFTFVSIATWKLKWLWQFKLVVWKRVFPVMNNSEELRPIAEAYKKYFEDLERRVGRLPDSEKNIVDPESIDGLKELTHRPHAMSQLIDSGRFQPIIHARVAFRKVQLSIGFRVDDPSLPGRHLEVTSKTTIPFNKIGNLSWRQRYELLPNQAKIVAALASAHLILVAGFGLWFWFTLHTFDINPHCISLIQYNIFGISVPTSSTHLRIGSIVLYTLAAIPLINILICLLASGVSIFLLNYLGCKLIYRSTKHPDIFKPAFFLAAILTLLCQIYFIVCTELMIRNNQPLIIVGDSESSWTLGQTLAVALTVIPLVEVYKFLKRTIKGGAEVKETATRSTEAKVG